MNKKRNAKKLSKVFYKELLIVLEKEEKENHFLNQDSYKTCLERASEGIDIATEQVKKIAGLDTAKHRQSNHGENRSTEIQSLTNDVKLEYKENKERAWWI